MSIPSPPPIDVTTFLFDLKKDLRDDIAGLAHTVADIDRKLDETVEEHGSRLATAETKINTWSWIGSALGMGVITALFTHIKEVFAYTPKGH